MKNILPFLTGILLTVSAVAQPLTSLQAPPDDGGLSFQNIPDGTAAKAYHRSCWLILQSELTAMALTNSVISSIGMDLYHGVSAPTSGQYTIYLQNTSDVAYNKGTSWPACLSGMSVCYNGTLSLPVTNSGFTTSIALGSNFNYTGGGIYVACAWYSSSAASSQIALAHSNNFGMSPSGGAVGFAPAAGPAPTTLTLTTERPSFRFGATNTATNELGVVSLQATGLATRFDGPQVITTGIRNNSASALSNVVVSASVSGANPFADTKTITSIGAGSVITLAFGPFTATNTGANTISVNLAPDQDNSNNIAAWTQNITCREVGAAPLFPAGDYTNASMGFGPGTICAIRYISGTSASTLASVNCVVPSSSGLGETCYAVVCDASASVIATGPTVALTASNTDVLTAFPLTAPLALTAGSTYYFGIASSSTAAIIGFNVNQFPPATSPVKYYIIQPGGGTASPTDLGFVSLSATINYPELNLSLTAASSQTNVCESDKLLLTASGADTYTWSNGANTQTTTTNFTSTGVSSYSVSGTTLGCKSNVAKITFSVNACTGLEDNFKTRINLFPNPTIGGKATIRGLEGKSLITIFNSLGQTVLCFSSAGEEAQLDLSEEAEGSYLVKVSDSNHQSTFLRLLVTR